MVQYYSTESICYLMKCHGIDCGVCPLDVTAHCQHFKRPEASLFYWRWRK